MKDITGERFGRLVATEYDTKSRKYLCKCDCGKIHNVNKYNLTHGLIRSCGCLRNEGNNKRYGFSHTRIDNIYKSMISRCYCKNNNRYYSYGGKGICVCDEWKLDKTKFFEWAFSNGYSENLTIDRIDVDGNYSPDNCRWVDYVTQENNRSNNRILVIDGISHTLSDWSRISGIDMKTIHARLRRNWNAKDAVFLKKGEKISHVTV